MGWRIRSSRCAPIRTPGTKSIRRPTWGFAWNPNPASGWLGKLLNPKTVIRGAYGINYYDEGLNTISNRVTANPGTTQAISLTPGAPGFAPGGLNLSSQLPAFAVNPA